MRLLIRLFAFTAWISTSVDLLAQRSRYWTEQPGTWLLNVGLGATHYTGDLSEFGNLAHLQMGTAANVSVAYRTSQQLSYRVEGQLYYIHAKQSYTRNYYNNLSFRSLNPDIWAGVQVDFWPVDDKYRVTIPYAFIGGGLTYMTPKALYKDQVYSLAPLQTEGIAYNRLAGIVRYGLGIPLLSSERFKFHLEGMYTHVLSDYLDDVSSVYADRSGMSSLAASLSDRRAELGTTLNRSGEQRGHTGKNDGYFVLTGRLVFVISTQMQSRYRRSIGR